MTLFSLYLHIESILRKTKNIPFFNLNFSICWYVTHWHPWHFYFSCYISQSNQRRKNFQLEKYRIWLIVHVLSWECVRFPSILHYCNHWPWYEDWSVKLVLIFWHMSSLSSPLISSSFLLFSTWNHLPLLTYIKWNRLWERFGKRSEYLSEGPFEVFKVIHQKGTLHMIHVLM